MKALFLLSFVLPLTSIQASSMKPEVFKNTLERLYAEQSEKTQQCNNQNQSLIKKAYSEVEKPVNEENFKFVENEKKALEYIEGIDLIKIFSASEENADNLFFTNCSEKNRKIYDELNKERAFCANIADEMYFMKSLIYATKNYSWSLETKAKAKSLILKYADLATATPNSPLLTKFTVVAILKDMSAYNLAPAFIADEVKAIADKAEKPKPKKKKKTAADLSACALLVEKRNNEIAVSDEMGRELQELLKKFN
jgi:hypothetical protein